MAKTLKLVNNLINEIDAYIGIKKSEQFYIELRTKHSKGENISKCPMLGLGTWLSKKGEVEQAVEIAIKNGYRHIDTAFAYGNEQEIGKALQKLLKNFKREDLFITTKLWNTFHNPDIVVDACKKSLKNLQLDYVDLYLIHWPLSFEEGEELFPRTKEGFMRFGKKIYSPIETWKGMEKCVELGLVRHIGVSNFSFEQVEDICKNCKIAPVMNQVESHPYLKSERLCSLKQKYGVQLTAYSPLGAPSRPFNKQNLPILMQDETLKKIAANKNVTVAKVLIRWSLQRGVCVIPKSVTPSRIISNFDVWDFHLTQEEMHEINNLEHTVRYLLPCIEVGGKKIIRDGHHPHFPFKEELKK